MDNKFNKEFEDFGWSEMQKMLDRELPVAEKKRRRGLVFWLFLMGSLLTISGIIYFELKVKNSELNTPINNNEFKIENSELNKPIHNSELKTAHSNLNKSINSKEIKTINSNLNTPINKDELKTAHLESNTPINNVEFEINSSKLNTSINSSEIINTNDKALISNELLVDKKELISNELNFNTSEISNFKGQNSKNTPPQYLNEKLEKVDDSDMQQDKTLTTEQIFALEINRLKGIKSNLINDELEKINMPIKSNYIKPIFKAETHFGSEIGFHTEGGKKIDGWQLGVVINRQFKKHWSLSTGLNFRKTTVNGDSLTNLNLGYAYTGGTSGVTSNNVIPVKKITLKGLNYLELPVRLNYSINKKWSVSAGIKVGYLISPNVSISADSTVFFLQNTSNKSANSVSLYDLNSINSAKVLGLERWDFATIGGIYFNPNKRIQLSIRYDYGFKNILNRANWAAYNRFLGLNAVYYFH